MSVGEGECGGQGQDGRLVDGQSLVSPQTIRFPQYASV